MAKAVAAVAEHPALVPHWDKLASRAGKEEVKGCGGDFEWQGEKPRVFAQQIC